MKFESRLAAENERLNIDPEAEELPVGVFAVDFGDHGVFCGLGAGDHVVETKNIPGFSDGFWAVQVCDKADSAFALSIHS